DGKQWGKLALGELTRGEFEKVYACRPSDLSPEVLKATTSHRTKSTVYVVFDGPGAEAHLTWVVALYNGKESPSRGEFMKQFGSQVKTGYLPHRKSESLLQVAAETGVATFMEGDADRAEMVIFSPPAQLKALADTMSAEKTEVEWALQPADFAPLEVRTGERAEVDLAMERRLDREVDASYLERLLDRAAEDALRGAGGLRLGPPEAGRTAVRVTLEERAN